MTVGLYPILDHADQALTRLAEQYKEKTRIVGLIDALSAQVQAIETALWDMASERALATADGVQLDVLGRIIGQTRGGYTDDEYRKALEARVRLNRSSGTPEDILDVFVCVEPDSLLTITPYYPACFALDIYDDITSTDAALYLSFLREGKAGGVRAWLLWVETPRTHCFTLGDAATYPVTSTLIGIGTTADATGGHFGGVAE